MKIGITGNIGSGKSTFAGFAEESGFPVLRTDDISKEILQNDKKAKSKVIKAFGDLAFKNNLPDKEFLAKEVFSNPIKLKQLESILHPLVIKKTEKLISELLKKHPAVFVESALIYEADLEYMFDYVVLITSSRTNRLKRKLLNGLTELDFEKREQNQIPEEEKKKRADFIFSNDTTIDELKMKFRLLLLTLGLTK